MSEDDGLPARYLLFGSNHTWMATAGEEVGGFDSVYECVMYANVFSQLPYMLVIDRHDPRVPIYLDASDNYRPFKLYDT